MRIAVIPGSYDPITLGHLDLVKRALTQFDEVVVAVMNNPQKTYMFDMDTRAQMVRLATAELFGVRVVADSGMLVDLFDRVEGTAIVKGVRNSEDLAYEQEMAAYNLSKNPRAKTVFFEAREELSALSSTSVRAQLKAGRVPTDLLPAAVAEYLLEKERL